MVFNLHFIKIINKNKNIFFNVLLFWEICKNDNKKRI